MHAMPTPRRSGPFVGCAGFAPRGSQRIEARPQSDAGLEPLAGGRGVAGPQRVRVAQLERIGADGERQFVQQRLDEQGGLGYAEAAERARHRPVRVHGPRRGSHRA
jgi:hypothetical protein